MELIILNVLDLGYSILVSNSMTKLLQTNLDSRNVLVTPYIFFFKVSYSQCPRPWLFYPCVQLYDKVIADKSRFKKCVGHSLYPFFFKSRNCLALSLTKPHFMKDMDSVSNTYKIFIFKTCMETNLLVTCVY